MKTIDPKERIYRTFENIQMNALGKTVTIPKIVLSMIPEDGKWCISFDEYNRVTDNIRLELSRQGK